MKFCLINNLYPPYARGGAETVVELLAKGLQKKGEVLIITTQPTGDINCKINEGLNICQINPLSGYYILDPSPKNIFQKFFWHWRDLFNARALLKVKKLLQQNKPDFVFTHNLKGLSLGVPKVIRKLGLTHIHTLHDYQLLDPHGSMHREGKNIGLKNFFYTVYRYLTRQAIGHPDLVISPSKFVLEKHLAYGFFKKSKCVVMANPIEIVREEVDIHQSINADLQLLYLGQLEPHKGIKFLLDAILKINDSRINLTIAGSGSQSAEINALAQKSLGQIKVIGQITRDKTGDLFKTADLLVLPSLWWENCPMVVLEAMAHKIPILASDAGGAKELILEGKAGWIFKTNDINDLSSKLKMILTLKNQLPAMGQAAYESVKDNSVENYVNKLLFLCQNLRK